MGRIIGITGQMATGKSRLAGTFAEYLAARGVAARILSIDSIRRYLMTASPMHMSLRKRVAQHFGVPLTAAGFDLQQLAAAVFRDEAGPAAFWRIAGDEIVAAVKNEMRGDNVYLLEWARLAQDGFLPLVDRVIVTDCAPDVQRRRLVGGDLPWGQVQKRLGLQATAAATAAALSAQGKKHWVFDTSDAPAEIDYHRLCDEVLDG